eukprot:5182350-Prymnesium_polylepis.1
MLKLDGSMRQEMQWHEPHTAYTFVLAVFRQAELRQPHRRHPTHAKPNIHAIASNASLPLKSDNVMRHTAVAGSEADASEKGRVSMVSRGRAPSHTVHTCRALL